MHLSFQADTSALIESEGRGQTQEMSRMYETERDACVKHFDTWSEQEQVNFVQYLLSRMCHYQHGQVNTFLKPMLQRDFISALPGKLRCTLLNINTIQNFGLNGRSVYFEVLLTVKK